MEKFSRYTDKENRLFVIIERLSKITVDGKNITFEPSTVTLLNVHAEKAKTILFKEFNRLIENKNLIRIN
jgi:hypothetical protein